MQKQADIQRQPGKEIVPVRNGDQQQVQIVNKFAGLEVEEGEIAENNQLALTEENTGQKSLTLSPNESGRTLNPATPIFNPKSPEIKATKEDNNTNTIQNDKAKEPTAFVESTT